MNTTDPKVFLSRTVVNLDFAKDKATKDGPYHVTQLVNSFLMTLLFNWDALEGETWSTLSHNKCWPHIDSSDSSMATKDCVGKIRDALAHGLVCFEGEKEIEKIHVWTRPKNTPQVDWHATITVQDMRKMLDCFVEAAKRCPITSRQAKRKGDE